MRSFDRYLVQSANLLKYYSCCVMLNQKFPQWVSIFFNCLRRGPNSKKYLYRDNLWYIKKHIKNEKSTLIDHMKKGEQSPSEQLTVYSNQPASQIPLEKLKTIVLLDIVKTNKNGKGNTLFSFNRTDTTYGNSIKKENHWKTMEYLLSNPVVKDTSLTESTSHSSRKMIPPFSYRYTINLPIESSTDYRSSTNIKLLKVLWPEPAYSNYVIGIGVNPSLFNVLNNDNLAILHPISRRPLKLFELEEKQYSSEGIAICPKYNFKHRELKSIDLMSSIFPQKLCVGEEIETIVKLIQNDSSTLDKSIPESALPLFNEGKDKSINNSKSTIACLDSLLSDANKDTFLWGKVHDVDKNCPSDILRSVVLSDNYDLSQIREEFTRHFTVFNMFSFIWRNEQDLYNINELDINAVKPWSSYIWSEYQNMELLPIPTTAEGITTVKQKFNEFLEKLHIYYYVTVSELKSRTNLDDSTPSESLQSVFILKQILTECKWFDIFYPNLSSFFQSRITAENSAQITKNIDSSILTLSTEEAESMDILWNLMRTFIETESMMFHDKFPKDGKALYQPKKLNSKVWKLVLLCRKNTLSDEVKNIIKYALPIPIHFVNTLEKSKPFENYVSVKEKMINEDLFLYVRKLKNPTPHTPMDLKKSIKKVLNN